MADLRRRLALGLVGGVLLAGVGCSDDDAEPLRADFRWDMFNGESSGTACSFETTYFHDESKGAPTSWHWELPDGTTSSEQNPTVDTPTPTPGVGFGDVTLTVRRGGDEDSITKDYVPNHC